MLYAYSLFHLNIAYSAIDLSSYQEVIDKCYWPLLKMASLENIPLGIELPAYTLEQINKIDPNWVSEFKRLIDNGKCELVGCGYSQIIAPLAPSILNEKNFELGNKVYLEILETKPQLALINEQAFSAGTVDVLKKAKFKAIIMDWNNSYKLHPDWDPEFAYLPQVALGTSEKESLPLLWNNSIFFQKFQRYVHGEIEINDILEFTCSKKSSTDRAIAIYGNDVEIFDFRPGRYQTEAKIHPDGEWNRIKIFYEQLKKQANIKFVLPSEVFKFVSNKKSGNYLNLQTPGNSIPVKKQEKYNVIRWGLSGRNDFSVNTQCWKLFKHSNGNWSDADWKELCFLWSSDFRTHIGEKRWNSYLRKLEEFARKKNALKNNQKASKDLEKISQENNFTITNKGRFLEIKNDFLFVTFDTFKGLALNAFINKRIDKESLFGSLPHGYFEHIDYSADFFSGYISFDIARGHKVTDLLKISPKWEVYKTGVKVYSDIITTIGNLRKIWFLDFINSSITLNYKFNVDATDMVSARIGLITLNPNIFPISELCFETHNGGPNRERFLLNENVDSFDHGRCVSPLISANQAVGMTSGFFSFNSNKKAVGMNFENSDGAGLGLVSHIKIKNKHLSRLHFSILETDDTSKNKNKLDCDLTFTMKVTN